MMDNKVVAHLRDTEKYRWKKIVSGTHSMLELQEQLPIGFP